MSSQRAAAPACSSGHASIRVSAQNIGDARNRHKSLAMERCAPAISLGLTFPTSLFH